MGTIAETRPDMAGPGGNRATARRRRIAAALVGPALIVAMSLFAERGFLLTNRLTDRHPDILSFWLPHACFLGHSLRTGHVPLWNPHQMGGMPFAADPQSGWLYVPAMLLSWLLPCATALRMFIVLQPVLAGLGLFAFLRIERLSRAAATAGGLGLAMLIGTSSVGISLPFAGTLAWMPWVLAAASGFLQARRPVAHVGWLALGAFAWGQVASAHMSHGLAMTTMATVIFLGARSVHDVRAGAVTAWRAALHSLGFLAVLPLANLAILWPRLDLLPRTSLRGGYARVGGEVSRLSVVRTQPLSKNGVWSGWPLALGSAPGAYAGATLLLAVPLALRVRGKRYLAVAFGATGLAAYLLTSNLLVGAGWFRRMVLRLPLGDVYLHAPNRLRYLMLLVVPVLGALGIEGLIERPTTRRIAFRYLVGSAALWLALPLVLGAHPVRFVLLAVAIGGAAWALLELAEGRRLGPRLVVGVLAAELLASAIYSQAYSGGTIFTGLEPSVQNLTPGPQELPDVPLAAYLAPGPIARAMQGQPGRYLTWSPPAAFYEKGYLFTQGRASWPALENGRGMLFGLSDALGYTPVQLTRYWSFIRAADRQPIFYNAAVIQRPTRQDVWLLGIRWLIAPTVFPPPVPAERIVSEGRYSLYEVRGWEPLVSVVHRWFSASAPSALRNDLRAGFDPAKEAVAPGATGQVGHAHGVGLATFAQVSPEQLRISVQTTAPSLVVVRDTYDPGWHATVDGAPVRVVPADYMLQGVPVPAGNHEVVLSYDDPAIGRGLFASGVVWLLLLFALIVSLARQRTGR